jgi:hypothetical protein
MEPTEWTLLAPLVLALPLHARYLVPREAVPHPEDAGFYRSIGLASAAAHYRLPLPDGRGLHVHEFLDHFRVHWDRVDPSVSLVGHFVHDVIAAARRGMLTLLGRREPLPLSWH